MRFMACFLGFWLLAACMISLSAAGAEPASRPLLVCFTLDGCRQCELDKPTLRALHDSGMARVWMLDAGEHPEVVKRWGVTQVPYYRLVCPTEENPGVCETYDLRQAIEWLERRCS